MDIHQKKEKFLYFYFEFSRVIRNGLSGVGHKNLLNIGVQEVDLLPMGSNKLFHKLFAT